MRSNSIIDQIGPLLTSLALVLETRVHWAIGMVGVTDRKPFEVDLSGWFQSMKIGSHKIFLGKN
jgi:hypothetical protein